MTYPQIRQDLFVHPSPSLSLLRIINGVTYGRTHRLIMDSNPRRREWQIGEILPPFPADKDAMHTPCPLLSSKLRGYARNLINAELSREGWE